MGQELAHHEIEVITMLLVSAASSPALIGSGLLRPTPAQRLLRLPTLQLQQQDQDLVQGARYDSVAGLWPEEPAEDKKKRSPRAREELKKSVVRGGARAKSSGPRVRAEPKRAPRSDGGTASQNLAHVLEKMEPLGAESTVREVGSVLQGRRLRPKDYTTLLSTLRRAGKWQLALRVGEWLDDQSARLGKERLPNLVHYNAMLGCCAAAGQHGAAATLLATMASRGVAADTRSYATAISACEQTGAWQESVALLNAFEAASMPAGHDAAAAGFLDGYDFGGGLGGGEEQGWEEEEAAAAAAAPSSVMGWLDAFSQTEGAMEGAMEGAKGDWQKAASKAGLSLEEEEEAAEAARRDVPDEVATTAPTAADAETAGLFALAAQLPGAMPRLLVTDDAADDGSSGSAVVAYTSAMNACQKGREWGTTLQIFDRMVARGLAPDAHCYAVALAACRVGGAGARASALLRGLLQGAARGGSVRPTALMFVNAMAANTRAGEWRESLDLFELRKLQQPPLPDDPKAYAAAVGACARGGDARRALQLLDEMQASPVAALRHNPFAIANAMAACNGAGEHATALRLYERLQTAAEAGEAAAPSELCVAFALDACGTDHSLATSIFERVDAQLRTTRTHNAMLSALARAQQWAPLVAAYDAMRAAGVPADERSYSLVIRACDQCDTARSKALFQELQLARGMTKAEVEVSTARTRTRH